MGSIFTIAKRDTLAQLSSPKAAGVFWFFLIFMGLFFQSFVYMFVNMQQEAPMSGGQAPGIEQLMKALFQNVQFILLLVIPAVSMASFAEEKKTHVFRLLQTAPIKSVHIVLGKYLSLVGVMTAVLLCSTVYPLYLAIYGNPDIGSILTAYLGLFLLICGEVALGMWISSMTTNQIMAFIFTMFGLFALLILNWIAPNITGGGSVEGVVKYLAYTSHFDNFLKGIISVADVTYFLCFSALFLFFTVIVLDSQRWR